MGDDEGKRRTTMIVGIRGGSCTSVDTGSATGTVIDSTNTEWTDEKHSLYLNSIEESFVSQLYNHDFCLSDSHGWLLRSRKDQHSLGSTLNGLCSDQFKVQRKSCWEKIKFERLKTQTNAENEPHTLAVNPWIKHFRSSNSGGSRHHRVTSSTKKHPSARSAYDQVSSVPAPVDITHHTDPSTLAIEVSDQNFTENECEVEKKSNRACKKKRLKTNSGTDASANDPEM